MIAVDLSWIAIPMYKPLGTLDQAHKICINPKRSKAIHVLYARQIEASGGNMV
jgi:hypothetical protein